MGKDTKIVDAEFEVITGPGGEEPLPPYVPPKVSMWEDDIKAVFLIIVAAAFMGFMARFYH